ncbi:hypothetical protein I3760_05G197100 [Carya illinoinensis]|nr:hypothetical protein I3760_05G197100 [Carya illinoinensis]
MVHLFKEKEGVDVVRKIIEVEVLEVTTLKGIIIDIHRTTRSGSTQRRAKVFKTKCLKKYEDGCHRCGMTGHWSRTCRTAKHLVDLYQSSIKEKIKKFETNFAEPSYALDSIDGEDITSLDVSDFFEDSSGRIDHGSVPF